MAVIQTSEAEVTLVSLNVRSWHFMC